MCKTVNRKEQNEMRPLYIQKLTLYTVQGTSSTRKQERILANLSALAQSLFPKVPDIGSEKRKRDPRAGPMMTLLCPWSHFLSMPPI
jgi:hypothetical protein